MELFFEKIGDCFLVICKWFILQVVLYFLMPYLWNYEYEVESVILMFCYTTLYAVYWIFSPKEKRFRRLWVVYLVLSDSNKLKRLLFYF